MADNTKLCRYCRTEIPKAASVCPQCRKRLGTHPIVGCLALLFLGALGMCAVVIFSPGGGKGGGTPSRSVPARETQEKTYTLNDGSTLTLHNVQAAGDWACGKRQTATMQLPNGQGGKVWLYMDNKGELVSITAPEAGNAKLYEAHPGKECLMNWQTKRMEMLTDAEYKKLEKAAGK